MQHRHHLQDGNIAIVMEYMDGGPLCGLVRQCGVLQEPVLAEVTRQTLQVGTPGLPVLGQCVPRLAAELSQQGARGWPGAGLQEVGCQRGGFACTSCALKSMHDAEAATKSYRDILVAFVSGVEFVSGNCSLYKLRI